VKYVKCLLNNILLWSRTVSIFWSYGHFNCSVTQSPLHYQNFCWKLDDETATESLLFVS